MLMMMEEEMTFKRASSVLICFFFSYPAISGYKAEPVDLLHFRRFFSRCELFVHGRSREGLFLTWHLGVLSNQMGL